MRLKSTMLIAAGGLALLCFLLPASLQAGTVYTYTGNSPNSFSITLDLSLTGAALDNIPVGTSVASDLNDFSMTGNDLPPSADNGGFPLGGGVGTGYLTYTPGIVAIGTDPYGNITSWDITETVFASYPAFGGENPTDFYCGYSASSTGSADSVSLTADNDVGFCPNGPGSNSLDAGTWSPTFSPASSAPEPQSCAVLGSGLLGVVSLAVRRKRRAESVGSAAV
jgi:hypothetical protein